MQNKALTIVESLSVKALIDKLTQENDRFEDVFEGIKWILARNPNAGFKIDGSSYFVFKTQDWVELANITPVVVLYTYDDNEILIQGIKLENKN